MPFVTGPGGWEGGVGSQHGLSALPGGGSEFGGEPPDTKLSSKFQTLRCPEWRDPGSEEQSDSSLGPLCPSFIEGRWCAGA